MNAWNVQLHFTDFTLAVALQEYLVQWVAKVAAAEKDYRSAMDAMKRPAAQGAAQDARSGCPDCAPGCPGCPGGGALRTQSSWTAGS